MKLKSYLAEIGLSVKDFAVLVDVCPGYISAIQSGKKKPGKKVLRRIKELTEGNVELPHQKPKAA